MNSTTNSPDAPAADTAALEAVQLPDHETEWWPAASIKLDERNAKKHPQAQVDQLRAAMREFGVVWPVLIRENGTLIAGEGRYLAQTQEGANRIKVIVARGWSETQCRKFALLDNRIPMNAEWDKKLLGIEATDLSGLGVDLSTIGFTPKEIAKFAPPPPPGATDPDAEAPEPPAAPISRAGDVWVLSHHRLLCGDSTRRADVDAVLNGAKPKLMVTDPPYGVEYDADWRNDPRQKVGSGARAIGKVSNDDRADWREAWDLFKGDVAYVWCASLQNDVVIASLEAVGFERRTLIIWAKNHIAVGRGHYHWQHEPAWYVVRKGKSGHWAGDRKQSTVWQIDKPQKSETGHSTQKPVECMKRPIENNSLPGDCVYEPFSGSGTTIIAGEMTGRHVLAIELNPAYVDVAVARWQTFSGKEAVLAGDGRSFSDVSAARRAETAAAAVEKKKRRAKADKPADAAAA